MRTLVVDLDIENSVKFLGKAENVDELFARSSIYVLPSVLEGFPNALCEAMIAGLPVVCFNGFPSHEIVTNGYDGIILNNSLGAEAIAFCLENLMHNADKRKALGVNAKKIRSRLDPEKVVESFLDFVRFN
jgi:glycosyltransferase involved in cell wall biosynthesis